MVPSFKIPFGISRRPAILFGQYSGVLLYQEFLVAHIRLHIYLKTSQLFRTIDRPYYVRMTLARIEQRARPHGKSSPDLPLNGRRSVRREGCSFRLLGVTKTPPKRGVCKALLQRIKKSYFCGGVRQNPSFRGRQATLRRSRVRVRTWVAKLGLRRRHQCCQ